MSKSFVDHCDCLREYYGPLLGHCTQYIREYSASTFALLFRKLPKKSAKKQYVSILCALVESGQMFASEAVSLDNILDYSTNLDSVLSRRGYYILDGLGLLLFHCCKGIKGTPHSKCSPILDICTAFIVAVDQRKEKNESAQWLKSLSFFGGLVYSHCARKLVHHLLPVHMKILWEHALATCRSASIGRAPSDPMWLCGCIIMNLLGYCISNSNGRALNDKSVSADVSRPLTEFCFYDSSKSSLLE